MLNAERLAGFLREFQDPAYAEFRAFPMTVAEARREWANAFSRYFEDVEEALLPSLPGHPTLITLGVESAFAATLQLESTLSSADAARDFSQAWEQGVAGVNPGVGVSDALGAYYVFVQFANIPPLRLGLEGTLGGLFSTPSASVVARLTGIAQAFHTATSGLSAGVTITTTAGVAPGVMGVR